MTQPAGESEVRIKLVMDDQTAALIDKLKENLQGAEKSASGVEEAVKRVGEGAEHFEHIGKGVHEAKEGLGGMTEVAEKAFFWLEDIKLVGEVIGEGFSAAYEMASKLAEAAIEAASEAQKQERAMTGLLSMIDQGQHSWQQIAQYVGDTREELEEAGIKAGVSADQMTTMFDTIVERGNMSSEKAKELTEQMALVGRITRGGMSALADGFAMMEMGVVRARNPLVQLISATGMLEGNAKHVAAALQKMSPEKQMELAEKAITKQAEMMKKGGAGAAPSLDMLKTSFEGIREMVLDAMGRPMLDKLLPPLVELRTFLLENKEKMIDFAVEVGTKFGEFIEASAEFTHSAYQALKENWESFREVFNDAFGSAKDTFQYIYDNKEAFAKTIHDVVTDLATVFHKIHEALEKMSAILLAIDKKTGFFGGAMVGAEQKKIEGELRKQVQSPEAPNQKALDELRQKYVDNALAMGQNAREAGEAFDRIYSFHADVMAQAAHVDEAAAKGNVGGVVDAYNQARQHHNEAMQKYAAEAIAGSEDLQKALLFSGEQLVDGGFKPLIDMIKEKNPEFAKQLKAGGETVKDIMGKGGPNVNFNNNTFHIKQDFRDQDPDRVIMTFRRDLVKSAAARTQARVATPFGL